MKFDKDTILKNRFWILVCVAAVLTLGGWIMLLTSAPAAVEKDVNVIKKSWTANKSHSKFVHKDYIKTLRAESESLNKAGSSVQAVLYEEQMKGTCLMTWPPKMERDFGARHGKYATEIVVHPKGAKPNLPPDDDSKKSGTLKFLEANWFEISDRDEKLIKFVKTPKTKVSPKEVTYGALATPNNMGNWVTVTYVEGKFFGEELTLAEIQAFRDDYPRQVHDVLAEVGPLSPLGVPVVLFYYPEDPKAAQLAKLEAKKVIKDEDVEFERDTWIFRKDKKDKLPPPDNRFFNYVFKWPDMANDIGSDEIWAAQENIWIQRELFKQIKAANDALARCEKISNDGKVAVYKNDFWGIELTETPNGLATKLKNLRPKTIGIANLSFRLTFKDESGQMETVQFPPKERFFDGAPVGPADSGTDVFPSATTKSNPTFAVGNHKLANLQGVEQMQTVETAAVKRIDTVTIGATRYGETALGHREARQPLKPYKQKAAPAPKAADPPPTDDKGNPIDPPPAPAVEPPKVTSIPGIFLERYKDTTPHFRKLPVHLVLIVSPEHVGWVQSYLISSPLRFFPTQVMLQRCQVPLSGGVPPGQAVAGTGDGLAECVELTLYGIMTLYERPGRPPQ